MTQIKLFACWKIFRLLTQKKTNIKYVVVCVVTLLSHPELSLWFQLTKSSILRVAANALRLVPWERLWRNRSLFTLALPPVRADDGEGKDGWVGGWMDGLKAQRASWSSELDLAGREGLVLHDYGAAGGQNHDVQVLLPLMGLLVPVPGHFCVVGWNQSHLMGTRGNKKEGRQ